MTNQWIQSYEEPGAQAAARSVMPLATMEKEAREKFTEALKSAPGMKADILHFQFLPHFLSEDICHGEKFGRMVKRKNGKGVGEIGFP